MTNSTGGVPPNRTALRQAAIQRQLEAGPKAPRSLPAFGQKMVFPGRDTPTQIKDHPHAGAGLQAEASRRADLAPINEDDLQQGDALQNEASLQRGDGLQSEDDLQQGDGLREGDALLNEDRLREDARLQRGDGLQAKADLQRGADLWEDARLQRGADLRKEAQRQGEAAAGGPLPETDLPSRAELQARDALLREDGLRMISDLYSEGGRPIGEELSRADDLQPEADLQAGAGRQDEDDLREEVGLRKGADQPKNDNLQRGALLQPGADLREEGDLKSQGTPRGGAGRHDEDDLQGQPIGADLQFGEEQQSEDGLRRDAGLHEEVDLQAEGALQPVGQPSHIAELQSEAIYQTESASSGGAGPSYEAGPEPGAQLQKKPDNKLVGGLQMKPLPRLGVTPTIKPISQPEAGLPAGGAYRAPPAEVTASPQVNASDKEPHQKKRGPTRSASWAKPVKLDQSQEEEGNSVRSSAPAGMHAEMKRRALAELKPIIVSHLNNPLPSLRAGPDITIDQKTLANRHKEAERLMRRFSRENAIAMGMDEFPWIKFANWMVAFAFRVQPQTYRNYRVIVNDYLAGMPGDDIAEAIDIINHDTFNADDFSDDEQNELTPEANRSERPHIVKCFPYQDVQIVLQCLRYQFRSPHAAELSMLIEASLLTGLRPSEWKGAVIMSHLDPNAPNGRRTLLFVVNAKATNGRGNGTIRSLDLSDCPPELINATASTINLAREIDITGEYERHFLRRFSRMMYKVIIKIWPNNPDKAYSLYSCRHQASANWKEEMTAIEVAALSGHAVPKTTQRWYGRARNAWPKAKRTYMAKPLEAEIAPIEERASMIRKYQDAMASLPDFDAPESDTGSLDSDDIDFGPGSNF